MQARDRVRVSGEGTEESGGQHPVRSGRACDRKRPATGRLVPTALALAILAATAMVHPAIAQETAATRQIDIPSQDLSSALNRLALTSQYKLLYRTELVAGLRSPPLKGRYTTEEALRALLQDTGLTFRVTSGNTILVERAGEPDDVPEPRRTAIPTAGDPAAQVQPSQTPSDVVEMAPLVVTGTNIRGLAPVGSPLIALDRDYLRQGGYSSVADVLEALPQASGSGASLDGIFLGGGTPNPAHGSAANLRGLGPQSTLTLLNGRRLPASGNGNFTDLSLIPVSAIERVDVLLDGASALYGSDAVSGVVNLITARDYEGAETSVRRGIATAGGGGETRVAQTLGVSGNRLGALLAYEYQANDAVYGDQRPFATGQPGEFTLLPEQRRHSALLTSTLALGDAAELFLDGTWASRKVRYLNFNLVTLVPYEVRTANEQFGISTGARLPFADDWQLEVAVDYGENAIDSVSREALVTRASQDTRLLSGGVKADGSLWRLPAGEVKVALGAGARREDLAMSDLSDRLDRTVRYAFVEANVPLVSREQDVRGVRSLTLSLAGRYERYSDFGSTVNPKVGFRWETGETLALRGSYGRSFRAPSLYELDESFSRTNLLFDLPDGAGTTRSLLAFGGNAGLTEERSKTWTVGADIRPRDSGFTLSATWYDITYGDRINAVTANLFDSLVNPDLAPLVIRRDSDPARFDVLFEQYLSQGTTFLCNLPPEPSGLCPEPPDNFGAIVDYRSLNISSTRTAGLDLAVNYDFDTAFGPGSAFVNINRVAWFRQTLVSGADDVDLSDTVGNPLKLRARLGVNFSPGDWVLAASANYAGRYRLSTASADEDVDSFVAFDLFAQYTFGAEAGMLRDLSAALSVRNVFDRAPPFTTGTAFNDIRYDPVNGDPTGRFVSFELIKRW